MLRSREMDEELASTKSKESPYTSPPMTWQNKDQTITLIDIPRSIAHAQGTPDEPCHDILFSTAPLQTPYPTDEPRSAAARAKTFNNHAVDAELHEQYVKLLQQALDEVAKHHSGAWCFPRPHVMESPRDTRKRDIDASNDSSVAQEPEQSTANLLARSAKDGTTMCNNRSEQNFKDEHLYGPPYNPLKGFLTRTTLSDASSQAHFRLPPQCSFFLSNCSASQTFHGNIRQEHEIGWSSSRKFPFILLDPPWPNRSIKRTHKTADSTYSTSPTLPALQKLILGMDLDVLMAPDCLVGIWMTNKPAVRDLVLGEGGLFDGWGVDCVEEWIWLKVTAKGEPVTPLGSVWRKPYEVLVLGRKREGYGPRSVDANVKRRVLMSVPDLHSRKPCLRSLVAPLVGEGEVFRGLEVFARHLVAGWWSWGDECIKFNWEGYWKANEAELGSGTQTV